MAVMSSLPNVWNAVCIFRLAKVYAGQTYRLASLLASLAALRFWAHLTKPGVWPMVA